MLRMIAITSVIVCLITVTSCTSINSNININPIETASWKPCYNSNAQFKRLFYDCNSFKIESEYIPVESKTYAIGFILPIIPLYSESLSLVNKTCLEV